MNYLVIFSGTRFDGKIVNGEPTCITISGECVVVADSQESAIEIVKNDVVARHDCKVVLNKIETVVPFMGGQKLIDRRVKAGGTSDCPLVSA